MKIEVFTGYREQFGDAVKKVFGTANNFLDFIESGKYSDLYDVIYYYDDECYIINRETGEYINWYKYTHIGRDIHSTVHPNDFVEFLTKFKGDSCDEIKEMVSTNTDVPKSLLFDFDKVKEILKRDDLDNLIVDHTCEEKQEQINNEKMIDAIDFAIQITDSQDDYSMGMRNGMRYVKSLIDGKEPQYEFRRTDEEIKLGLDLGDEVVGDYGSKGVVVGIDTYEGEVLLSLLMRNHKVPQLVKASGYKTKTGKHFSQIREVLEQISG